MKRWALWIGLSAGSLWSQSLDLSSLDKLQARAKEVNRVTLDSNQLRAAMQLLPQEDGEDAKDTEQLKKLVAGLESVTVLNFEFEKKGNYREADLESVRLQLAKFKGWAKIVDSKEKDEHSEVYMLTEGDKPMGIAVIDAEPTTISVVLVKGLIKLSDLGKLNGFMGVPHIDLGPK